MRRFFCQNCGEEVQERDEICRSCGAIFVAIQCPQCGFRGKQHRFGDGCPECGYLGSRGNSVYRAPGPGGESDGAAHSPGRAARRREMPSWVFWLVLGTLALSFVVLALIYARL